MLNLKLPKRKRNLKHQRKILLPTKRSSVAVDVEFNEEEMFVSSDVEYFGQKESDRDDETFFADEEEKYRSKIPGKHDKKQNCCRTVRKSMLILMMIHQMIIWKRFCGPLHGLNPRRATPFNNFCVFIPIYFFACFANYTNKKAELVAQKIIGHIQDFQPQVQLQ